MIAAAERVTVTGIAAGGDGVARMADGRVVFVPRTAPGDRVALDPLKLDRKRSYARGVGVVETPGPDRVTPACPHYDGDRCGECQLQHLAYPAQIAVKSRIVGDTVRRIGKLDVPDPEVEPAAQPFRYRAKITLSAGRRGIGYHAYDRPGYVFPLQDCHITDQRLMTLWSELRRAPALLGRRPVRVTLRLDRDGWRHVIVESADPWRDAERLRGTLSDGERLVCWWRPVGGAARVVGGAEVDFPAPAVDQVNPPMGATTRAWAADALGDVEKRVVWDLYGGVGDAGLELAARGADVVSVDADESAVAWARRRPAARAVRFIAGRCEDVVSSLPEPHAVILNPPRAGLHWDVTLRLTGAPVPRLVYVSRDPATLARDLYRLGAAYRLTALRGFDLFPQTAHLETVAVLEGA